jgi:adenine-specific DNA-methyltransferase
MAIKTPRRPREQPVPTARQSRQKANGIHYTPAELARFVARRGLEAFVSAEPLVIFDPACGDGELLIAASEEARARDLPPPWLLGTDTDPAAIAEAQRRLRSVRAAQAKVHCEDFLSAPPPKILQGLEVDLMISNPPYVRTQVLGAARSQDLARQFDLRGRVDLYHAFVAAMTECLPEQGILALLCSNRFLTTRGGSSLRGLLDGKYTIREIWDLGDSKLFDAAVLPAVIVARMKSPSDATEEPTFVRAYEAAGDTSLDRHCESLLQALDEGVSGPVQVEARRLNIERGTLAASDSKRPWQLSSSPNAQWLASVRRHSVGRLGEIGPLRVGIKTTADKVFISDAWHELPEELRPESAVLRPLLTHHIARRWRADCPESDGRKVLYTHEATPQGRQPIDLAEYPRAAAYLELHRERLEGRKYIQKAGRRWYEIWVPQQPERWAEPKLVWPDISEGPRFFLDESGAVVNGDCYWLSCGAASSEDVALMLAVANSTFTVTFYDICCGNRLYAGRRRFITQYLEDLPIPAASSETRSEIAGMVAHLRRSESANEVEVETSLDVAVHRLFGVEKPSR